MRQKDTKYNKIRRFLIGLTCLVLFILFFASGITPPGVTGEVLRHNQVNKIDASPLFYSEVENMRDLEKGVQVLRDKAEKSSR